MIGELVKAPWQMCERENLAELLSAADTDVVVSFGAGNIDAYCAAIAERLQEKA